MGSPLSPQKEIEQIDNVVLTLFIVGGCLEQRPKERLVSKKLWKKREENTFVHKPNKNHFTRDHARDHAPAIEPFGRCRPGFTTYVDPNDVTHHDAVTRPSCRMEALNHSDQTASGLASGKKHYIITQINIKSEKVDV